MSRNTLAVILFIGLFMTVPLGGVPALAIEAPSAAGIMQVVPDTVEVEERPAVPRVIPEITPQQRAQAVDLDTVRAGRFDSGRMWTFEAPPLDYFEEEYGFVPEASWLEGARLGTLRMPGCSASFASPHGLVLTNHHCARDHVTRVSREGENLLHEGFYAQDLSGERRVEGLSVEQLVQIEDVSDEVEAALEEAQTDAERAEARRAAFEEIAGRLTREAGGSAQGFRTEVVPLYGGARHSAYVYRRYDDVRLAMVPELQIGYYGGDTDNFTYPRYALDMALFRVYDDGEPLQTDHFFPWSTDGALVGEAVFVVGNPGSTLRMETVAQLEYRRDVLDAAMLRFLETRVEALEAVTGVVPDEGNLENMLFGLRNARKLFEGRVDALRDPVLIARRADAESSLQEALSEAGMEERAGLIDEIEALQDERRELSQETRAFLLLDNPAYSSNTLRRALAAHTYLQRQEEGAAEQTLEEARAAVSSVPDQPEEVDQALLAARLQDFQEYFGEDDEDIWLILRDRSPEEAARAIIAESVLSDSARTQEMLTEPGSLEDDPALEMVAAINDRYRTYQSAASGLQARQQELTRQLGQARYAVYGDEVPPDATFTLRIADGRVQEYPYNGTLAPAFTSFSGLLDQYYSHGGEGEWDLPARWLERSDALRLSIPLNMVSSNDITGGNSGSPVINQDLELVGVAFDGNIESLASDYIFRPERMRAVSVDSRGMFEALHVVYDADRLVVELLEGLLIESDGEAEERVPTRE